MKIKIILITLLIFMICFLVCFHRDIYLFFKFAEMRSAIESVDNWKVVRIDEKTKDLYSNELNAKLASFYIQIDEPSMEKCFNILNAANEVLSDPDNILCKDEYLVKLCFEFKWSPNDGDYNYSYYLMASNIADYDCGAGRHYVRTMYRCNYFCTASFNTYYEPISKFSDIQIFENDSNISNIIIKNHDGLNGRGFFDEEYDEEFTDFLDKYSVIFLAGSFFDEYDIKKIDEIKSKAEKCKIFSHNDTNSEDYKECTILADPSFRDLERASVEQYAR